MKALLLSLPLAFISANAIACFPAPDMIKKTEVTRLEVSTDPDSKVVLATIIDKNPGASPGGTMIVNETNAKDIEVKMDGQVVPLTKLGYVYMLPGRVSAASTLSITFKAVQHVRIDDAFATTDLTASFAIATTRGGCGTTLVPVPSH